MPGRSWLCSLSLLGALSASVACTGGSAPSPAADPAAARSAPTSNATSTPAPDLKAVAASMVRAGLVATGDKVLITGSARDAALLENLAIETMKAGGQPLITLDSEQMARRSYDEVPVSYDSQPQSVGLAIAQTFDVQLSVDVGENDALLAGVPPARIAARAKASQPIAEALLKRSVRTVNLGNGLYPTAPLAARLTKPQPEFGQLFWKAVAVPPETIRSRGETLRRALIAAKQVTLTSANGTNLTFGVQAEKGFVSEGALTPDKVKQGRAATETWLPAGELLVPVAPGTADGKIVVDKLLSSGQIVEGVTLTFVKGTLTSMTAKSGIENLKARYDASSGGKDQFAYIDLGLNPEVTLPTNTGRIVWMAAGGVTIGVGDNTGWGGTNVSNFSLPAAVTTATLTADGKALIENGTLK
jgi:aminopeptidase